MTRSPRPTPRSVKRPSASVIAGWGQAGKSLPWTCHKTAAFEGIADQPHVTADDAAHQIDDNLDAPGRPPLHVEETPLDYLFGTKCDLASGLGGIRVEVNPGGPIAGCQRNGAELIVTRRGNSS